MRRSNASFLPQQNKRHKIPRRVVRTKWSFTALPSPRHLVQAAQVNVNQYSGAPICGIGAPLTGLRPRSLPFGSGTELLSAPHAQQRMARPRRSATSMSAGQRAKATVAFGRSTNTVVEQMT
jgi:hypothetical protein